MPIETNRAEARNSRLRCAGWRILMTEAMSGAENMAWDMALMDRARSTGEGTVRVYSWSEPTLSFGRNQKTVGYDREALASSGLAVVRRPTGGRSILHHREITYSVTAPATAGEAIAAEYAWINSVLIRALQALGVSAEIASPVGRTPVPDSNPCFAAPTAGEITLGGRKLVGSAQYREAGAMLQHGSILVADDQSAVAALAGLAPTAAPATLEEVLGRAPAPSELYDAIHAIMREDGLDPQPLALTDCESVVAQHVSAFENPEWTWRR